MSSPSPNPAPLQPSSPPPTTVSPPPRSPPGASEVPSPPLSTPSMASPPPKSSSPPEPASTPPPANAPPPSLTPPPKPSVPPPPPVDPPAKSPRHPPPTNPHNSPPPPNQRPPPSPISPVSPPPPTTKPPSLPAEPPKSSPPPPPPPIPKPPESSPPTPLPTPTPPQSSPPPPLNSGTTPAANPSPTASPPSSDSSPLSPPPPPPFLFPPPAPLSPSILPPGTTGTNISSDNAPQNSQSNGGGGLGTGVTMAIALALAVAFLSILGIAACFLRKRNKASGQHGGFIMPTSSSSSQETDSTLLKLRIAAPINENGSGGIVHSHEPSGLGNSRSWFTYEELVKATNGFSTQNLLGEGGFGFVYRGNLVDGRDVAVKQLRIGGGQGEREFRSEVEIISRVHHRHLVSLVGYCINENRRLLVYDYVPNNNLYFHLHGEGRPVLDWATRVKIALGAARGIAYLHEDCYPRIIHRDIKSSNILLDSNFEARVSDFGLAKLALDANTHITTRVMGTFGYMAPEYASSGKLTERSDVYSFGVVLLELITGHKPVDASLPLGDESLVEWARPLLTRALELHEFGELADPRLNRQYVDSEMFRTIEAAAACVRHSSLKRPKMGQVVRALDTMASTDLTNGMRVGESEMFNPSAEIRLFRRMAFGSQNFSTSFFRQDSSSGEGDQVNSGRE